MTPQMMSESTTSDSTISAEEEQVYDDVDLNSPKWSLKVKLEDVFNRVCNEEEEEDVYDDFDLSSQEWALKVKLEDVGKQVCEQEEEEEKKKEEEETVYDDCDFSSEEWALKVKLEDVGKEVCERKFRLHLGHALSDPLFDSIHSKIFYAV
ncbi:unnamed protein product [Dibothriocephalus latus]|uniref:Uncharacterized protein n=1 Tax=Dibothriocephalus latus TaxID=60516 RepID=A0A3P7NLW0_DIBLA|nr:unnamed protein product [Dibothriocephalus latus]